MPDEAKIPEEFDAFLRRIGGQKRYSKYTLRNYSKSISDWYEWLAQNELFNTSIFDVPRAFAKNYAADLSSRLSRRSLHNRISALRSFHRFLRESYGAKVNPFSALPLPKLKKDLPVFLSERPLETLLGTPWNMLADKKITRFEALRDSLALELLYGAGLRISELCSLRYKDLDLSSATARVLGKGGKTRLAPFGAKALEVLRAWKDEFGGDCSREDYVLRTERGGQLYPRLVQRNLKKYLAAANLPENVTPHKLRHSFATHMVDGGADLRALQEMMGHSSLSTTQVYTHLSTGHLKQEHSKLFD